MIDEIEALTDAATKLNEAAVEFAKRNSPNPLQDGSALGLQKAAYDFTKVAEAIKSEPLFGNRIRHAIKTWKEFFQH